MELTASITSIAALVAPAAAVTWTIVRDRSRLARIEQIGRILDTAEGASFLNLGEQSVLRMIRRKDIEALGRRWVDEDHRRQFRVALMWLGLFVVFLGVLLFGDRTSVWATVLLALEALWSLAIGIVVLRRWRKARTKSHAAVDRVIHPGKQPEA